MATSYGDQLRDDVICRTSFTCFGTLQPPEQLTSFSQPLFFNTSADSSLRNSILLCLKIKFVLISWKTLSTVGGFLPLLQKFTFRFGFFTSVYT